MKKLLILVLVLGVAAFAISRIAGSHHSDAQRERSGSVVRDARTQILTN
jgi:hypothetical protein